MPPTYFKLKVHINKDYSLNRDGWRDIELTKQTLSLSSQRKSGPGALGCQDLQMCKSLT